jgi:large subunit ribosomal protein L31e
VNAIKNWVAKMMKTQDVRIDPKLNQFIWSQGIRNLPRRVRVRISRKRNEEEGNSGNDFYSLVQHVHVEDFSSRLTEKAKVSA